MNVSVNDALVGAIPASAFTESAGDDDELEPGETWSYTYGYTVQATDPDPLTNTSSRTHRI